MSNFILKQNVTEKSTTGNLLKILDEWAARIPFSPIKNFSKDTLQLEVTELVCYTVTVTTQIQKRWFENQSTPYRRQSLPDNIKIESDYKIWSLDFILAADFASHRRSQELIDTRHVYDCSTCNASGKVTCGVCSGYGKVKCSTCSGAGNIRRTRDVPYTEACYYCNGTGRSDHGRGNTRCAISSCTGGQVKKTRQEEYYVPCAQCAASGKVVCSTCRGHGVVTCAVCEGCCRIMGYLTAEQSEDPVETTLIHIPSELPNFRKSNSPISNLAGPDIFVQDERCVLNRINIKEAPATVIIINLAESCRKEHAGHIDRQRVRIQQCSIYEYSYKFNNNNYSVFINESHKLVEDLEGPIQATIGRIDEEAQDRFNRGLLGEAYRLNTMALCMDEATAEEKSLRLKILKSLTIRHSLQAVCASFFTLMALFAFSGQLVPNKGNEFDSGAVAWWATFITALIFSLTAVVPFSRDKAISMSPMGASLVSAMIGVTSSMLSARVYQNSSTINSLYAVILFLAFCFIILLPGTRKEFRRKLHHIEDTDLARQGDVQGLEKFIKSLNPSKKSAYVWCIILISISTFLFVSEVLPYKRAMLKAASEEMERAKAEKESELAEKERLRLKEEARVKDATAAQESQRLAEIEQKEWLRKEKEARLKEEQARLKEAQEKIQDQYRLEDEEDAQIKRIKFRLKARGPFKSGEKIEIGDKKTVIFSICWVPAGQFLMGSDQSDGGREVGEVQHEVTLTDGLFFSQAECTQRQWKAIMETNPSRFQGNDLPVEQVSWNDASEFCQKLTEAYEKNGLLPSGWKWRLPTEAEWEFACRAGTTSERYGPIDSIGWYTENSNGTTHPPMTKRANLFGLYDMIGNVREWCFDRFGDYQTIVAIDPKGLGLGQERVHRGGSWLWQDFLARAAERSADLPNHRASHIGFRPVLSGP